MSEGTGERDYKTEFSALLNNSEYTRSYGFLAFITGAVDLSPLKELCFSQDDINCLTFRYNAGKGSIFFPLMTEFLSDIHILSKQKSSAFHTESTAQSSKIKYTDKGKVNIAENTAGSVTTTGSFHPEIHDSRWNNLLINYSNYSSQLDINTLKDFFYTMQSALSERDRLIIFCEITGLGDDVTYEKLGFDGELMELIANHMPRQFGIVISGVPDKFEVPPLERHSLLIDVRNTDYGKTRSNYERSQPFENDSATGEDRLEIKNEINALADAIAARDMTPPLVVGVLGGWGSGKSFVLHLLKERLLKIRSEDLSNPEKKEKFPYVGHPYVIKFDAWTYAKSNLWASLMQEILVKLNHQISMEQVLASLDSTGDYIKGTKAHIWNLLEPLSPQEFSELSATEAGKEAISMAGGLDAKQIKPDALWNILHTLKDDERQNLIEAEEKLTAKRLDLAKAKEKIQQEADDYTYHMARQASLIKFSEKLVGKLGGYLKKGMEDFLKNENDGKDFSLDEVQKSLGLIKKLRGGTSGYTVPLLCTAAISAVWFYSKDLIEASLLSSSGIVFAGLDALKRANSWLESNLKEFDIMTESALQQRSELRERFIEQSMNTEEIRRLTTEISAAESKVDVCRRNIGITARHVTLMDFLKERLDSGLYSERLGLLQQVQQDIHELSATLLMKRFYENGDSGNDHILFQRGKPRIILIIDDLDRCPPSRVVEVLEAAQLLVKTSLFVIVLAMDVRYITRALEKEYEGVLVREGMPSGLDYIEKIVQIPYRVRPIAPEAIPAYIRSQVKVKTKDPSSQTGKNRKLPPGAPGNTAAIGPPNRSHLEAPLPVEIQEFDTSELDLLKSCTSTIEISPRSMKRLINVYKLLKIIWYRSGKEEPGQTVKRTLILLLTLSARYPNIMRRILLELELSYNGNNFNESSKLVIVLRSIISTWSGKDGRIDDWNDVLKIITTGNFIQQDLTLESIEQKNIRLVRCFSFVGEVDPLPDPEKHKLSVDLSSPVNVKTDPP